MKVKTTREKILLLDEAVAHLLKQKRIDPLFGLRLAGIRLKIAGKVKHSTDLVDALKDACILRNGDDKKVLAEDRKGRTVAGRYRMDPEKSDQMKAGQEEINQATVRFRAPTVSLQKLVDNWAMQEDAMDDPETFAKEGIPGINVPGWVILAFFGVGLLELDVKDADLDWLLVLAEDEEDDDAEDNEEDGYQVGPVLPGDKAPEPPKSRAAKRQGAREAAQESN